MGCVIVRGMIEKMVGWTESWQPSKVVALGTGPLGLNIFLTRDLSAQLEVINLIEAGRRA